MKPTFPDWSQPAWMHMLHLAPPVPFVLLQQGGAAKLAPFTSRGAIAAEADLNDNASMKSAFKGELPASVMPQPHS